MLQRYINWIRENIFGRKKRQEVKEEPKEQSIQAMPADVQTIRPVYAKFNSVESFVSRTSDSVEIRQDDLLK